MRLSATTRRRTCGALGALALSAVAFLGSYDFDEALFDPDAGGPLVVVDRRGEVLRRVPAPDGRPGRAGWVPLSRIGSHVVLTVLASEDQGFFEHAGVDAAALLRAAWLTATTDRVYGGSTLTMQLARLVHSQGKPRTVWQKLLEVRAALGIERHLDKREILEQYLNRAYYGHGAYGIDAAAWRYFGKPARSLSVGEATFLAVLPRGPGRYDPVAHPERVLERRHHLLGLLVAQGRLSPGEAERAEAQPVAVALRPFEFAAPHFVDFVLAELPPDVVARGGTVHTTLDLALQRRLEARAAEHVRGRVERGITDAGVVVLDAPTGAILAMVGSRDYRDPDRGQVNITTWRRYPGSALKPFVYATAIEERGDSPATIAYDVREVTEAYRVPNVEFGPASYRAALAGSYNFAAVGVLERAGLERVMERLRRAGVSELRQPPSAYGPRLALGSTKVRLLDLTAGYGFLVREGRVLGARGVDEVVSGGRVVHRPRPDERPVFDARTSWLVMDVLADPDARRRRFGYELPVDLPYDVAAKTGTAEGFADTVAVLATRELLVGAWTGRLDGRSTQGQAGMRAAAPLARAALLAASDGRALTLPPPPSSLERHAVCPDSGLRPGPHCLHRRHEHFAPGTAPARTCDWHLAQGRVRYPDLLEPWLRRTGQHASLSR